MSLHKNPELKAAILDLPAKEKDKLLVRLIGKDKKLMQQLHYELLEDQEDLAGRIEELHEKLLGLFSLWSGDIKNLPKYAYYKGLSSMLRSASGLINDHERITKDRFSVAEARIFLLQETFKRYPNLLLASALQPALKLHKYLQGRIKNMLTAYNRLHEDLQFDLSEGFDYVIQIAEQHGLAGDW